MKRRNLGPKAPNAMDPPVVHRQLAAGGHAFDVETAVTALRYLISKTEAFATTADDLFEDIRNDPRRGERVAWLVTEASEAAQAALAAANKLAEDVVKHRERT